MAHVLHVTLRMLAGAAGALSSYAALFLYEDEQGKLQNKLEKWWLRVNAGRTVALSRQASFMREVARLETLGFDRLFGERLFSLRAFTVSLWFSSASIALAMAVGGALIAGGVVASSIISIYVIACILVGSLLTPAPQSKWPTARYVVALLFGTSALVLTVVYGDISDTFPQESLFWLSEVAWLPVLSFGCDIGFIALTRWIIRRVADADQFLKAIGLILFNLAIVSPVVILFVFESRLPASDLVLTVGLVVLSNTIDVVVASVFAVLAAFLLTHRVLWPLIDRPFYALQGVGIARRRWLFGSLGLVLLGCAGLGLPDTWKEVVKAVAG